MKVGTEVEGRFIGLRTLFCSADEFMDSPSMINARAGQWNVHQIYISDLENKLDLTDLNSFIGVLALDYIITVECTKVPQYTSNSVNIMLHIQDESFWRLRPRDQVKFSRDQTVFAVTLENMTHTVPEDFAGDTEIE